MVRVVIASSFSVNMLSNSATIAFQKLSLSLAKEFINFVKSRGIEVVSIVGHKSTADLLTRLLGVNVPTNRISYSMSTKDIMLVFTVPFRLPEGKVLSNNELEAVADRLNIFMVFVATTGGGYPPAVDTWIKPWSEEVENLLDNFSEYLKYQCNPKLYEEFQKYYNLDIPSFG